MIRRDAMESSTASWPTIRDVEDAADRIRAIAARTTIRPSRQLSDLLGASVGLKLETTQPTGAFKVRGAANAILRERELGRLAGVVTASTGNHGIAVAYVAHLLDVPAVVCLPRTVARSRVAAVEVRGATVELINGDQTAAIRGAHDVARQRGFLLVPPFDHPDVISGAGTVGLELRQQAPSTQTVIVPVSGGGLAAGVGLALKSVAPDIQVIGVGAERAPAMRRSLDTGRPVATDDHQTVASSLQGDLGPDNRYSFSLVRQYVDEVVLVPEAAIVDAMKWALVHERLVIEGAAAVGIAYLRAGRHDLGGQSTTLILTGDNVDSNVLEQMAVALSLSR